MCVGASLVIHHIKDAHHSSDIMDEQQNGPGRRVGKICMHLMWLPCETTTRGSRSFSLAAEAVKTKQFVREGTVAVMCAVWQASFHWPALLQQHYFCALPQSIKIAWPDNKCLSSAAVDINNNSFYYFCASTKYIISGE